ncbi:TPR domain protein [Metarhizium guizhouense ARSEF 977]|uniref:TPR domain protein n=1 Tax=Metarhizium guizhouense (strain ARSEF 977) TaxID=1276136 RepID=A0A0B4HUK5_METGA|nr:TPR domain protein [Metarhizium guizhouense ARSEF 977]
MKLETHHRGARIVVRICTPPQRMTAVMAIVEDEQSTAVLLQLYHQPTELVVPADEIMQKGGVLVLKEPFFKCCTDGAYSLRVDHVSDIIWLDGTEECVPSKWRRPKSRSKDSTSIRVEGNQAVTESNWAAAHRLYTSAIKAAVAADDERLAYLNRSLANLRLGHPEKALSDAVRGSHPGLTSEKGLFRQARALYELGEFGRCMERLNQLLESHLGNEDAHKELIRAKARLDEQQSGKYAFGHLYKQARRTPPLLEFATYSLIVEVRKSPGRGRGLFTTRAVSAGEVLLCEKAFAYSYAGDDDAADQSQMLMNLSTKRMTVGGQARLLTQIIQKLYHNPQMSSAFKDLHHGDYKAVGVSEADGTPVVDSFLVEKVISLNSFGAPRSTFSTFFELSKRNTAEEHKERTYTTCGIWLLASRVNHSCVGNCRRSFIGDMQIIRATRDLEADTELFFSYRQPTLHESYEKTQQHLRNWGFRCSCPLCENRQLTPVEAMRRRKTLNKELKKTLDARLDMDVCRAQRLLKELEATYPDTEGNKIRLDLWDPYFALGAYLLLVDRQSEAIEMIAKGFEALDYGITACPQRLHIERWGVMNDFVPWAFVNLFKAYTKIAPDLCKTAKKYAETAYSMVVGESETILDKFPELA